MASLACSVPGPIHETFCSWPDLISPPAHSWSHYLDRLREGENVLSLPLAKGETPPKAARGSLTPSFLLLSCRFPHVSLGLRGRGGVHIDIAIKVQVELLENWNQGFDVIVCRLARSH